MHNMRDRENGGRVVDRRDFIRAGGAAAAGLGLAGGFNTSAYGSPEIISHPKFGHAKSVIQIAIWGGMSQIETFDPKPNCKPEWRSVFKPIPTNVPGIQICETLPMLAKIADKYAILRSMYSTTNGHDGYPMIANSPQPAVTSSSHPSAKLIYPDVGAIVGMKKREDGSYQGKIPAWVGVGGLTRWSNNEAFLDPKYKAFITRANDGGGLSAAAQQQFDERRELLEVLTPVDEKWVAGRVASAAREEVFQSLTGDAQKLFDLSTESAAVKERYMGNESSTKTAGYNLILARRLAEYGVPFISVNYPGSVRRNGKSFNWDMHGKVNDNIRTVCPVLDRTVSALLEDLDKRGILDTTIVTLFSEAGKAPSWFQELDKKAGKPNGTIGGRGHYHLGFSVVVAGGGFQGGKTVGQMDENGEFCVSRPIYPWDMWESIYLLMGIDPHGTLPHPSGCVAPISKADACGLPRGGLLTEIM